MLFKKFYSNLLVKTTIYVKIVDAKYFFWYYDDRGGTSMTKLNNKILPEYLKANDLYDSTISKTYEIYKEGSRYYAKLYEEDVCETLFIEYTHIVEIAGIRVLEKKDSIIDQTSRNIDEVKFNLKDHVLHPYDFDKYLRENELFARIAMLMNGIEEQQLNDFADNKELVKLYAELERLEQAKQSIDFQLKLCKERLSKLLGKTENQVDEIQTEEARKK